MNLICLPKKRTSCVLNATIGRAQSHLSCFSIVSSIMLKSGRIFEIQKAAAAAEFLDQLFNTMLLLLAIGCWALALFTTNGLLLVHQLSVGSLTGTLRPSFHKNRTQKNWRVYRRRCGVSLYSLFTYHPSMQSFESSSIKCCGHVAQ